MQFLLQEQGKLRSANISLEKQVSSYKSQIAHLESKLAALATDSGLKVALEECVTLRKHIAAKNKEIE